MNESSCNFVPNRENTFSARKYNAGHWANPFDPKLLRSRGRLKTRQMEG